jgi:hypothetical protein
VPARAGEYKGGEHIPGTPKGSTMPTRTLTAIALTFALLGPARAADDGPVRLEWKFEANKTFYQTMTTDTTQKMKVMGMQVDQAQNQTFVFRWTALERTADGAWTVRQKIEAVKMHIEIGGNTIEYDSINPKKGDNPLADFFKALVGAEFKMKIDKDLRVTKIEGRDEFVKKLSEVIPAMKPLLEQILSDDALKQMSDPTFAAVPNKEVRKGETWMKESKLSMGPIGTYSTKYTYTYNGADGDRAKIGVKAKMTYAAPEKKGGDALPFKIVKAELKASDASGTLLFDTRKGRVEKSDMKLKLTSTMTIEIGGMETEVDLDQAQTTTVATSDENPVKKAEPKP